MKNQLILMIALLLIISSCKKDQSIATEQNLPVDQVSQQIVNYVDDNYPDAYINSAVMVSNSTAKTIVTLNTAEELAFNNQDHYLGNGENFHPENNPMGQGFGHGHHHGHMPSDTVGHGPGNGHCHGFEHGPFHGIPIDSLSSAITTYISTNYSGYQALHAENDSLCSNGSATEVMIAMSGSQPLKLIFDASGNFLMSGSRIDYSASSSAVQSTISSNYSGYTPRRRAEKFILAGGQIQYGVFLFNGTTHKRVIVADDGTVVCEQ